MCVCVQCMYEAEVHFVGMEFVTFFFGFVCNMLSAPEPYEYLSNSLAMLLSFFPFSLSAMWSLVSVSRVCLCICP